LSDIQIEWIRPNFNEGDKGIVKVEISLNNESVVII
jgi:hypothetical protein